MHSTLKFPKGTDPSVRCVGSLVKLHRYRDDKEVIIRLEQVDNMSIAKVINGTYIKLHRTGLNYYVVRESLEEIYKITNGKSFCRVFEDTPHPDWKFILEWNGLGNLLEA